MSEQGDVIRDLTLPVVVHFSISEDSERTLQLHGDYDGLFYWEIPDFMTDSLFCDFLCEIIDAVSDRDTEKFIQLLQPSSALEEELRKFNRRRLKWFRVTDDETNSRVREIVKRSGDSISPYPLEETIRSIDVLINNDTDPTGELRKNLNQAIVEDIAFFPDLEEIDEEIEEGQDITVEDGYPSDEEQEINEEVQANPETPCYYPSQIEMAAILKKRIDTIMSHYHNISSLSDVFNDVEFVVYTARYRMLSDQTEKRICHPDAGVLSKEELESRDGLHGKKRMFMYVHSTETEKHFQELKRDVHEKPNTLFVIIADECHWGITKDKEEKPSAHNLFINEWCKDKSPQNVVVVQISATPFNLLTQNSRLPGVRCSLLNNEISTNGNDYQAGDLVVLQREPDLEEHVKNNSKEVELHVVHWSEVELKSFERGMRMKLRSTLNNKDAPNQYLQVSSDGKLGITSTEDDANDFIVQGSNGIVILKVLPTNEQQQAKPLTVSQDANGNLVAKVNPPNPTQFEVKLDFGVGVLAFCSCAKKNHYLAVDQHSYVSLKPAIVERKCGVSIMKPPIEVAKVSSVSYQFFIDRCGPAEVDLVGQQYMSLNFYLSTMNSSNKNEQKIRKDVFFQKIVDKAKRQKKTSKTDAPSFSVDALLCSEYCYYILLAGVYDSEEKIREALTSNIDESPVAEFDRKVDLLSNKLRKEQTNSKKFIEPEAFEFVRKELCDKATDDFKENLKKFRRLSKQNLATGKEDEVREVMEDLTSSFVACLMYLPQNKLQKIMEDSPSVNAVEEIKQRFKENDCREMIQKWNNILQEGETSFLVENLIRSGKGEMGRMKIVRAKSMKTADQFYFTLRLTRSLSSLEECFEVIRDYGGIQIEKQLMKSSSPFFWNLQPEICAGKFDCRCRVLKPQAGRKKCGNCDHVHKSITLYEDLENLACVLILVEKGRMGDTFPQSFDCLDLRLNYDSSCEFKEGSLLYLSTIIQELGRMCRYSKSSASETPYVLVGRVLFNTLQKSLETSPSMSAISSNKIDRYMTKSSRSKGETFLSLRWLDYEAHKDSYDYQNAEKHCNRILLHAEPQIGKTGAYLCLIRDLRLDILGKKKGSLSTTPAFDEGIFYQHKQCHVSEEIAVSETMETQDWQFPYWKTIKNSPRLYDRPVALGKYSIGGCFYTHDLEESPFILMNREQQKATKSDHQYQQRECADGVRAWHWYHFEKCVECGRLLQGKEPVLETFEVHIDGEPVTVTCSVPSSYTSFKYLLEQLKRTRSEGEAAGVQNSLTSLFWIFHASHRDDPRKCTLNYHHVMQEKGQVATYIQAVVVRNEKFDAYRSTWGKVLTIVQLPDKLPNCELGPNEGGVGYARLFIQKMSFALNLEYIFVMDDNIVVMSEAVFRTGDPSSPSERVLRDENGVMQMQRCSFLKPLSHLQKIAQGKDIPPIDETKYEPHPLTDEFESQQFPLYRYTGPAKLFGNKQHESYGVLGLIRSVPVAVTPYLRTQVYAAILLNVKSTVGKGVFYRPWLCWEDLRFNDDCDKAGLWVVKCNRYSFLKVQYKDWINNLVPPKIFEWKDDNILEERPIVSELPKDFEEDLILKHLSSLVSAQGPEMCFKGCLGYEQQEDIENTVCPARIVQQVQGKEATEEDFTNGVPAVILSFCATNSERKTLSLLDKIFCSTKEKIIFVASAEEAIEEWPQMSLATIASKKGICFCSEMRKRNANFSILSAADPKRHRLRYILVEASFPKEDKNDPEGITGRIENRPANIRSEPVVDGGTSFNNAQPISKEKKRVKRSLPESFDDSVEIKRLKTEKNGSQLPEDVFPDASDDISIIEERCTPKKSLSSPNPFWEQNFEPERKQAKTVVSEFKRKNKEIDLIRVDSEDSVDVDEEIMMASEKMDFSESGGEENEEVDNVSSISILSENQETSAKKRDERIEGPGHIEGTNDVTKDIVSLWREFRNLPGSSWKNGEKTGSYDLSAQYVKGKLSRFSTDQLEAKDDKGYTALLKACSLPTMSPHVMQHLIIERKVDINCTLPETFDRNHSATKGLIPGMSALSVAIKSGNVKLVPTFTRRKKEISFGSADDDGNTALHHCVLSASKFSFEKLFPLFKPLKWKTMHNNEGKNPLEMIEDLDMTGYTERKKNIINDMRQTMEKMGPS